MEKKVELSNEMLEQVIGGLITKEKTTGYYCEKCGKWYSDYEKALEHEQGCTNGSDGTSKLFSRIVEVD